MKRFIAALMILFFVQPVFAFSNPFAKKYDKEEETKEPMVHTVEEWMESATNVKMDMRKREEDSSNKDENLIPPSDLPLYIERYNVKAGSKELDLTRLFKTQNVRSVFVADPDFKNAAYSEVYYYPQTRQTASVFYLIELDGHLGKKERLSDVSIFEHTRYPLISTALPYLKEGLFSTLTTVDFSSSGREILVKEKRGSNQFGLYETYVWIYYLTDEDRESNACYRNNIDFANEMTAYDGIDGKDGNKAGKDIGGDLLNLNSPASFSDDAGFKPDLKKLSDAPKINLIPEINSFGNYSVGEIKGGEGIGRYANEVVKAPDMSWLKEEVTKVGNKNYSMKDEDIPKLDYKEVRNFIKAVWKDDEMTSPYKTRWYNQVPVDFRVDIPYPEKENIGFGVRLNLLNEMIKAYWFDRCNLILNHIRWDLKPLGFSLNNKDEIIVIAWAYDTQGREISLGRWAVNIRNGLPRLIPEDETVQIQANGFYLQGRLNPR